VMRKLADFQKLGHIIDFIIGDFTAMIGDPTGKSKTRKQLTREEVQANSKTYQEQVFKILDPEKTNIVYNNDWCGVLKADDIIRLSSKYTVARMLERDDFSKRYAGGIPISVHEFLYPIIQAYDSVHLKSDVEMGGTDQKFNFMVARDYQREYGQVPQCVLLMPILEGTDGVQKMSKSLGNYIGITDSPREMFGKTMSIPDELMVRYFRWATDLTESEVLEIEKGLKDESLHPRDVKRRLGKTIVRMYHSPAAAEEAEKEFEAIFVARDNPDDMEEVHIGADPVWIVKVLVDTGAAKSNGEARRLIKGGGVQLDGEKVAADDAEISAETGKVLKVGKRRFYKLVE
jgi:tyrosyl-tRNA synthetase